MTLNSNFALNTVFRVESFSMDTLVLRHDCLKIHRDAYTVYTAIAFLSPTLSKVVEF